MNHESIQTQRLTLWSMTPAFLSASWEGSLEITTKFAVPADWLKERALIKLRWDDLLATPSTQPWLLRAVIDRQSQQMIGHIGFHTPPDPPYLSSICPGAVEFGYTIYPPYRRRGYAREAATALMQWAHRLHGVVDFIASADPSNEPSVNLLRQLGFERIGGHLDEVDGYEDIYHKHFADEV